MIIEHLPPDIIKVLPEPALIAIGLLVEKHLPTYYLYSSATVGPIILTPLSPLAAAIAAQLAHVV